MRSTRAFSCPRFASAAFAVLLASCGGDGQDPLPVANGTQVTMLEDQVHSGLVSGSTTTGKALRFVISALPTSGVATIDVSTGAFTYSPNPDFFGQDSFQFRATDGERRSAPAQVNIQVQNVNDAPVFSGIENMMNSPETFDSTVRLRVRDADGDNLTVTALPDDAGVATVVADAAERSLKITPGARGATTIRVNVSDGEFVTEQVFQFGVGDVTKIRVYEADSSLGELLTFTNSSQDSLTVTFEHNGFPLFQSELEMVEFVRNMSPVFDGESFERKLWRFARNNVYHNVPLNNDNWLYDSWVIVSSKGWGFCGHVSATFVRLARAAGYEARIWGLGGHVVPEIRVDGRWRMYDPDLGVYYLNRSGEVAGVEELVADTTLFSAPDNALFKGTGYDFPYSSVVSDIYGSAANNYLAVTNFMTASPAIFQPLVLPGGASFTYPGRWTETVTGVDGDVPYEVPYYLQGKLTVPAGLTGPVVLPWMLWEIRGSGQVRIGNQTYEIGSPELVAAIQQTRQQIPEVEVLASSTEVEFIVFMNAMRYGLSGTNTVRITGQHVWKMDVQKYSPSVFSIMKTMTAADFAKPVAPLVNVLAMH